MAIVAKKRAGASHRVGAPGGRTLPWIAGAVLLALAAVVATLRLKAPEAGGAPTPQPALNQARTSVAGEARQVEKPAERPPALQSTSTTGGGVGRSEEAETASGQQQAAGGAPRPPSEVKTERQEEVPVAGGQQPETAAQKPATIFENPVEDCLEAVSRHGFDSIVTLRVNLSQDEILEFLHRPVEIYDDDDEETVAAKERTAEMKAAALDFIEAGGTFNQFLRDCQAEATEAREAVRDVREEMKRILLERGQEAAQAYLDAQNPLLREQGLEEVHIGKGLLMMMERRRESTAAGGR